MNSLKLNIDTPTDNFDSEVMSETSVDSVNQAGGAFGLDIFFGRKGSSADDLVVSAAKDKVWPVVQYIVSKNTISSLRTADEHGNNVLHYVAISAPENLDVVNQLLALADAKSALNAKNKEGNTPLHIAVQAGNNRLADLFISKGADPNIRNKDGLRVVESEETDDVSNVQQTQVILDGNAQAETLNRMLQSLKQSLSNLSQDSPVTDVNQLPKSLDDVMTEGPTNRSLLDLLTEDQTEPKRQATGQMTGGNLSSVGVMDTETFLDQMVQKYGQKGGVRRSNKKSKTTHTKSVSRGDQLSRLINNQASEIHNKVVKKIMELMEVDEDAARDYKAALWRMVKEKNPDMKSNLDLSVELEKMVKKPALKKIDLAEAKSIREESRKNRQLKKTSSPVTSEAESTSENGVLSSTSDMSVDFDDEDFLSDTSY